jgi:cellulose biosynthesis protein BcsQ
MLFHVELNLFNGKASNGKDSCSCQSKGRSRKTTTSVNLSAAIALQGKSVLLVDLDPQGNATSGGWDRLAIITENNIQLPNKTGYFRKRLFKKQAPLVYLSCHQMPISPEQKSS